MLEASKLSDQGCIRTNNEDYCAIDPELGLYILADGMGGARAGECASRLAVDTVSETMLFAQRRDMRALRAAVEEAHRRVLDASRRDHRLEGMGTTLVAALEVEDALAIASVGDSRAYVLDSAGLRPVTVDQTWVNDVGRPLGIDEDSLRTHPMRHVLTMAIGASSPLSVNCYEIPFPPGAMALICSDGLHGVVEQGVMEAILRRGRDGEDLNECCQLLVEAAKQAGGPDNVTVVVIRRAD